MKKSEKSISCSLTIFYNSENIAMDTFNIYKNDFTISKKWEKSIIIHLYPQDRKDANSILKNVFDIFSKIAGFEYAESNLNISSILHIE